MNVMCLLTELLPFQGVGHGDVDTQGAALGCVVIGLSGRHILS